MLKLVEADGTIETIYDNLPRSFLPDGTGMRVLFRFVQASENLTSYDTIAGYYASYSVVRSTYATYNALLAASGIGVAVDYDVTCMCSGAQVTTGHSGLFADIEAATATVSVIDPDGLFDPRNTSGTFGPGRRVRAGTWCRVELYRADGWHPLITGLVDTWERVLHSDGTPEVSIALTDAFQGLASAHYTGTRPDELSSARISALAAAAWSSSWGGSTFATGAVTLYGQPLADVAVLDAMKSAIAVEDGRIFVAPDGTLTTQLGTWRNNRAPKLVILGPGGDEFRDQLQVCTYQLIAITYASYNVVRSSFLIYDDMKVCRGGGSTPMLCASQLTVRDSSDDEINQVVITWKKTGSADQVFTATNAASIAHYGLRGVTRDDLTPLTPSPVLPNLAQAIVSRNANGDASISAATLNLVQETGATDQLLRVYSGDLVSVVDKIPQQDITATDWTISTSEVMGMVWNMTPSTFELQLTLDDLAMSA